MEGRDRRRGSLATTFKLPKKSRARAGGLKSQSLKSQSKKVEALVKLNGVEDEEPEYVDVATCLSKVYGYSLYIIMISTVLAAALSSVEWTKWLPDTIQAPSYDEQKYVLLFSGTFFTVALSLFELFHWAGWDFPSSRRFPAENWRYALRAALPSTFIFCGLLMALLCIVPFFVAKVDPRFYLLDQVSMLLVVPLVAVVVSLSANFLYRYEVPLEDQPEEYKNSGLAKPSNSSIKPENTKNSNISGNKKKSKEKRSSKVKKPRSVWITIRVAILAVAPMLFNSFLLVGYPLVVLPIYRSDSLSDTERVIIVCFVHWFFVELSLHSMRLSRGEGKFKQITDESREHYTLSYLNIVMLNETCFLFMRRAMISMIKDPVTATIAIAFTGVEEMLTRTTMVQRDRIFREWNNMPKLSPREEKLERDVWTVAITHSMVSELGAIVVIKILILFFRPHRFVFNFGYGFDDIANSSVSAGNLLLSMFLELICEALVDVIAMGMEITDGIDLKRYWKLFHRNPYAYIGCHISIFSLAILFILWAFHLGPSPFFCTSPDPCTCKGGGYEIYYNYCGLVQDLTKLDPIRNATTHTNLMTKILAMKTTAKSSFHVEEAFGGSLGNLVVGSAAFLISVLVFFVAIEVINDQQKALELDEVRKESKMKRAQTKLLRAKADEIMSAHTDSIGKYKIPFNDLEIEDVLGQGAYGIVCRGRYLGEVVAIKLIADHLYDDEEAIVSFKDEIELMCPLRHRNVIFMYGACWHGELLENDGSNPEDGVGEDGKDDEEEMCLVVEFAARGTLEGLVDKGKIKWSMGIECLDLIIDAARGMRYLHDRANPIVHRDLKPENILVNGKMVAKISDFGASRVVGMEDALSTCAGTPLFAAPEVSASNTRYSESCDVWSFAMIMAQIMADSVGLKFVKKSYPASINTGSKVMQYHRNGNRPEMSSFALDNDDLLTSAVFALVKDCWKDNPSARPAFKEVCIRLKKIRKEALDLPVSSVGMPRLSSQSSRNQLQNMLKAPLKQNTLVGQRLSVEKRNSRSETMVTASALATKGSGRADGSANNASDVKSDGLEPPPSDFRGVIEHTPTSDETDVPNSAVEDTDDQTWEFPLALYHELTWHIYGYTLALAVLTVVFVGVLSLAPWTRQPPPPTSPAFNSTAVSVPSYDRTLYVFGFLPLMMVLGTFVNLTTSSSFSNPVFGEEPYMHWRFGLVGGVPAVLFFGLFLHTAVLGLPYGVGGIDPCYSLLDAVVIIPFTLSAIPIFKSAAAAAYDYRLDRYLFGEWKSDAIIAAVTDSGSNSDDNDEGQHAAIAVIEQKLDDSREEGDGRHGVRDGASGADDNNVTTNRTRARAAFGVAVISVLVTVLAVYPIVVFPIYRSAYVGDVLRLFIICAVHPLIVELLSMGVRFFRGYVQPKGEGHPMLQDETGELYAHHRISYILILLFFESNFVFMRRALLGGIHDLSLRNVAIFLTGLEEAVLRSTMVPRDDWFRKLQNLPKRTKVEEEMQNDIWAAYIVHTMMTEFGAIFVCRAMIVLFEPHKLAFNVGASTLSATGQMLNMFVELICEVIIDVLAVGVELKRGLPLQRYWKLWARNPIAFTAAHTACFFFSATYVLWGFKQAPNAFYCSTSDDPCSCVGGGFDVYAIICASAEAPPQTNFTLNFTTTVQNGTISSLSPPSPSPLGSSLGSAARESGSDSLSNVFAEISNALLLSLLSIALITIAMTFYISRRNAAAVEKKKQEELKKQERESVEREKLAKQVDKVLGMREKSMARYQVKPSEVLIDELATLGKGRYGVVKEGLLYGETVAVKVLSALADEKAIESFVDEIDILGPLHHENIVFMHGACWGSEVPRPFIVLEYAGLGSLSTLIALRNKFREMEDIVKQVAEGLAFLHSQAIQVVHRDIKSSNVLVTATVTGKISDFGIATRQKDKAMTTRSQERSTGTPLYAAPSTARNQRPDPLDDIFSFGILMLEVATELTGVEFIRAVYPSEVATAVDIVQFHAAGKRPVIPRIVRERCGEIYASLIEKCWADDILERPVSVKVAESLELRRAWRSGEL